LFIWKLEVQKYGNEIPNPKYLSKFQGQKKIKVQILPVRQADPSLADSRFKVQGTH